MMVYPMEHWPWVCEVKVTRKGEGQCNFWPIFSKFHTFGHIVSSRLDMLMILGSICMFLMMGYPMEHWPWVCEVKVTRKGEGQCNFWPIFSKFHTLGHIVSSRLDMLMILDSICMFLMMGYPMEHWPWVFEVKVTRKGEGQCNFWLIFSKIYTFGHIVSSRLFISSWYVLIMGYAIAFRLCVYKVKVIIYSQC